MRKNIVKFVSKRCYMIVCKKCGAEQEEGDMTPHFETRQEAKEHWEEMTVDYPEEYETLTCGCKDD